MKIFLIDDDVTALDLLDILFERGGFDVQRFTSGERALEELEAGSPALIMVDLMMPGMNGERCIHEIRARQWNGPIIAFTAIDDPELHERVKEGGCDLVLTKPCKPAELIEHAMSLLYPN